MLHRFSYFSGEENDQSLNVDYKIQEGQVIGNFQPENHHTSYKEVIHGGLLAALLDDAMAYCINSSGITAFTGKLEIRFRKPPKVGDILIIKAWIANQKKKLYYTQGTIENNNGEKIVEAKAVFMVTD